MEAAGIEPAQDFNRMLAPADAALAKLRTDPAPSRRTAMVVKNRLPKVLRLGSADAVAKDKRLRHRAQGRDHV